MKNELLEFAKKKSKMLLKNTKIRLTEEIESYTLYDINGVVYIGVSAKDPEIEPMFKNRSTQELKNLETGKVTAINLQRLF